MLLPEMVKNTKKFVEIPPFVVTIFFWISSTVESVAMFPLLSATRVVAGSNIITSTSGNLSITMLCFTHPVALIAWIMHVHVDMTGTLNITI